MNSNEKKDDKDSWSKAINTTVNIVIVTALVAMVFGFFATFGAMSALMLF